MTNRRETMESLTADAVAARLWKTRSEVFGLVEAGELRVSPLSPAGRAHIVASDVDRYERCHAAELEEFSRRAKIEVLNSMIAEKQPWVDMMLSRGATPEDIPNECRRLVALMDERNALERTADAEVVRLLRLGIDPPWFAAAQERIRRQEQASK
jgi:hypothetical protein